MRAALLAILLLAVPARADDAKAVTAVLDGMLSGNAVKGAKLPQLSIMFDAIDDKPSDWGTLVFGNFPPVGSVKQPVVGISADRTAAWIAGDVAVAPCQRGALPDDMTGDSSYFEGERCKWEQKGAFARWALLVENDGKAWQPVVWHLYGVAPGFIGPADFHDLPAGAAPAAAAALAAFASSLATPKAMIAGLSPRKDTALFGSAAGEHYVGAAAIGAALAKWNLAFLSVGPLRAGTAGKSVAWIVANLKATSLTRSKQAPNYYRALFIYEHTGDKWLLVQASFSDELPPTK